LFSFFFLLFLFVYTFKSKQKKDKERDKNIPCMMCITNHDATKNGSKCNDVMKKKKILEEGEGKQKKNQMIKKL
jgi:hypothetical protein